ncbi:sodium channel and clathrin linker 1 isoform X1 [Xiphophorus couchianus]|uniref:sodium channel and clathrin linker 1 isoform X1 n=1 Tax=Xiphophorus couchianus TaxID=32473 RepID=UPI001017118F|nr:sodium channel and clathrin linker 1 isoform X1 [Xiphophorus couchianus]XP_027874289.1 sodium channel and clathrin linker 1 isoform X1 [Xiphophorus couchianus]
MDAEIEFLRDQVHRLNSALSRYQLGVTSSQLDEAQQAESPPPWLSDRGIMAPLIAEYDRHMDEMTEKLQKYQEMMTDVRLKLEKVVEENERLHTELRESIEKQLHSLPVDSEAEGSAAEDTAILKNLQEQVQLSEQERKQAMELWHTTAQELDRLQQVYQRALSDGQLHNAQRQQLKDQLVQFQQHSDKLQAANQKLESTNQQLLKTVTEQSTEMEELHCQLRQAKAELRTATARVDEMTKFLENLQKQMKRKEEDMAEAQAREDTADRRLQQLQTSLSQQETRLKAASLETEAVRREQAVWETKVGELQARCTTLEEEKFEALSKVRENVQVAEEAVLQKEQSLLREKQKTEELEKTTHAIKLLIQEAAVRTRKEVENVRKQCNIQIHRMAEELSALQLECADKEAQIERSQRERKAVEEELEKVYKEGRVEPDFKKIEALHQRCLNAERLKDDANLTLQSTQKKLKKMEMDYSEEVSRCQEEARRLQDLLAAARSDCVGVSDERLQLQQENTRLRKEMDDLRKASMQIQRNAKQKVSEMEQACSLKEQGLDSRVKELEERSRSSSADLTRLLAAQQKSTQRWKEEAKNLEQAFESKITALKAELKRQKQRSLELENQLQTDHNTISEYEKQLAEYQEKTSRLQRRLTQAEQKATTASHQLNMFASQRRKPATVDPGDSMTVGHNFGKILK